MDLESPVSLRVVDAISKREGTPPSELTPPLHHAVDTDALDALYDHSGSNRSQPQVTFRYKGYRVHIDTNGDVQIHEKDSTIDTDPKNLNC